MIDFQKTRQKYQPKTPKILENLQNLSPQFVESTKDNFDPAIKALFPKTCGKSVVRFVPKKGSNQKPLRVGVVFSGGQASGGHNVITGLYDALQILHPESVLIGFLNGPEGIVENQTTVINQSLIESHRNQGGFDLLFSGRTKIETPNQFKKAKDTMINHSLNGLVIIGGDDSNTNAAFLAEYFSSNHLEVSVIGVPKTIDGDLKNNYIESSFGFDTATKTYSAEIGNIQRDALSAKKYYFFIKLMGRSASHIALECALQTHPNYTLIGEEIKEKKQTFKSLVTHISDMITERSANGKDYGVILIPEGVIEFIPEFNQLINELNALLSKNSDSAKEIERISNQDEKILLIKQKLHAKSSACYDSLPVEIQYQLILQRDPHGNVQVSKIETERLFINAVKEELKRRKLDGSYQGSFNAQPLFFGYEGRSCYPSNFDANYCYSLGAASALLIQHQLTGYMAVIRNLISPPSEWRVEGIPLLSMMGMEHRAGQSKAVIKKSLVDLTGKPFLEFSKNRKEWATLDSYSYPGPIQYEGPSEITNSTTVTLRLEQN